MDMREEFRKNPILAIMRNVPLEKTIFYGQAVVDGGISMFEVALNSRHGLEQIRLLRKHFGDTARIGAGTAVTVDLVKAALDAGAMFLLAPSCPVPVLEYCAGNKIRFLPGVLTPTDVGTCLEYGFSTLKLFPAGDMPAGYVKSLKGPFDNTEYVAIGGVTPDNLAAILTAGYLGAGLGSNLFPREYAENNQWDQAANFIREILKRNAFGPLIL
ncbi:MAG: aldolase [Planctomycetes bacterium]|nr:aldolase [Planctomycetota bacterium]